VQSAIKQKDLKSYYDKAAELGECKMKLNEAIKAQKDSNGSNSKPSKDRNIAEEKEND
jgi:hypothetical protein